MTPSPGRLIDLSHTIEHGMVTYPGLPVPVIGDWLSRDASQSRYAPGTTFQIGKIELLANTGTYIDAPFHRYDGGKDISDYPLQAVANLEGIVVRATVRAAVLIHTGWDVHWRTERYGKDHPFLTRVAAERLVAAGVALVGIDSLNIDDAADGARPAHSLLLAAGIPIVEHLCSLRELPDAGFRFYAVPPRVKGMGSFPVRAFAVLEE